MAQKQSSAAEPLVNIVRNDAASFLLLLEDSLWYLLRKHHIITSDLLLLQVNTRNEVTGSNVH